MLVPRSLVRASAGLAAAILATAALVLVAAPASAHNRLISSDPVQDATLATPPTSITLLFDDEVLPVGTAIEVTGPAGRVELGAPAVEGNQVVQPLPADLTAGRYSVLWRVTSGDGHPIDGALRFTAAADALGTQTPAAPVETGTRTADPTGTATAAPESGDDGGGGVGVLPWAVLGGVVVVAGAWLATRRRGHH